jgi:uncharacterized membrane protein
MKTMRKQEFMDRLREKLSDLPIAETEERLGFYEEMIDDRMEEGLSEEEAVAAIGSPDEIAAQIIEEIPLKKIVKEKIKPKRKLSVLEIVLLVVGFPLWFPLLIVVPFSVIASLYATLWSVIVSLWAVFGSLIGSAAGVLVGGVCFIAVGYMPSGIVLIGASLFCAGLSVFLFFGCKAATKGTVWLTKRIALGIKNLFIRKEKAQ